MLLLTSFGSAQGLQQLKQQLQAAKGYKDKIYVLDALATYYSWSVGKDSLAEIYGEQQLAIAKQSASKELMALAYHLNGIRLLEKSLEKEVELGKKYFDQVIRFAKENNLPFYEASAYTGLSKLYFNYQELDGDKAIELGNKALEIASSISNDSLKALSIVAMMVYFLFVLFNVISN
jgi:hypothetical protein